MSVSAGKSFLVSALDKVSIFAHKLGMRLFAGQGKVEIQAQSDDLDIIAEKVMQIISAKESVHIMASEKVLLTAGGSYISIDSSGIEEGTSGKWQVHAASRSMAGPASLTPPLPSLADSMKDAQENARPFCPVCV
jgi:type VI secretion system secreted protein VgrG